MKFRDYIMLDVIMISQGQGLACRKQHRVVSDAVELKVKGRIEILDIKKKITFIYRLMQ